MEQNNYATKVINVYIKYDLDYWPRISLRSFTLKNCVYGATNIVKNNDKENYVYSGYGIAFDGEGTFNDDFARNVIIFGVGNIISLVGNITRLVYHLVLTISKMFS